MTESLRFNPPPNWPASPPGFAPDAGWQPPAAWGPPPPGWPLWIAPPPKPTRTDIVVSALAVILLVFAALLPWSELAAPLNGGSLAFTILIPIACVLAAAGVALPWLGSRQPSDNIKFATFACAPAALIAVVAVLWDVVGGILAAAGVGSGGPGVGPGVLAATAAVVIALRPRAGATSPFIGAARAPGLALMIGAVIAVGSLILSLVNAALSVAPMEGLVIGAIGGLIGPALLIPALRGVRGNAANWLPTVFAIGTGVLVGGIVLGFTATAGLEQFGSGWYLALFAWVAGGALAGVTSLTTPVNTEGRVTRLHHGLLLVGIFHAGLAVLYIAIIALGLDFPGMAAAIVQIVFSVFTAVVALLASRFTGPHPAFRIRVANVIGVVLALIVIRLFVVLLAADVAPITVMDLALLIAGVIALVDWLRNTTAPAPAVQQPAFDTPGLAQAGPGQPPMHSPATPQVPVPQGAMPPGPGPQGAVPAAGRPPMPAPPRTGQPVPARPYPAPPAPPPSAPGLPSSAHTAHIAPPEAHR